MNIGDYGIPLIALIGTLFGGAGLEFIKRWLAKAKEKDTTATDLRNELRGDLTELKKELEAVEKEVTEWKNRYYDVMEKKMMTEHQLFMAQQALAAKKAGSDE